MDRPAVHMIPAWNLDCQIFFVMPKQLSLKSRMNVKACMGYHYNVLAKIVYVLSLAGYTAKEQCVVSDIYEQLHSRAANRHTKS